MVPDRIGRRASHPGGWALTMSEIETTDDADAHGSCDRCGAAGALGYVKLGANNPDPMCSTYNLCETCIESFGEWYDGD